MATRMNISTGLAQRWSNVAGLIKNHIVWTLAEQYQPIVHVRAKVGGGISFSSWLLIPNLGVNQFRRGNCPSKWPETTDFEIQVAAMLDHSYELGLFARAIESEIDECDPEGVLYDDEESHQPWAMLMPIPMRRMLELGLARIDQSSFIIDHHANLEMTYDITYVDSDITRTHQVVEKFEFNAQRYRYFYGKSLHYLRIFDCTLPLTVEANLKQQLLSKIVDVEMFHHSDLRISSIDKNKNDLTLHMQHVLYPSSRPPL